MTGTTGLAFAQYYPAPNVYPPPPAYGYYQPAPPYYQAPPTGYGYWPAWDGTHSGGTGGRAYPWGQKTN